MITQQMLFHGAYIIGTIGIIIWAMAEVLIVDTMRERIARYLKQGRGRRSLFTTLNKESE